MRRIGVGLLALTIGGWAHGQAAVYSSGSPNQGTIWYGDVSNSSATEAAAEFTLSSGATINQMSWWGGFTTAGAASSSDAFSMSLYSAAGGQVGSLIATVNLGNAGETSTGKLIQASPEYAYNASFASIVLGSGTYFIGLQRSGGPGVWGWESANGAGLEAYLNSSGMWGYNTTGANLNLAFSLGGTLSPAPEASTSLMLALGLLAVGFSAVRQRQA